MARKMIFITGSIILLAVLLMYIILKPTPIDVENTQQIYIETIGEKNEIEKVVINSEEDTNCIKNILSGDTIKKFGFVFSEGGYRLVLIQGNKKQYLYPYCGELGIMRIGNKNSSYYEIEEDREDYKKLEKVINKYIVIDKYKGSFSWELE